jgi:hypothetical protein
MDNILLHVKFEDRSFISVLRNKVALYKKQGSKPMSLHCPTRRLIGVWNLVLSNVEKWTGLKFASSFTLPFANLWAIFWNGQQKQRHWNYIAWTLSWPLTVVPGVRWTLEQRNEDQQINGNESCSFFYKAALWPILLLISCLFIT